MANLTQDSAQQLSVSLRLSARLAKKPETRQQRLFIPLPYGNLPFIKQASAFVDDVIAIHPADAGDAGILTKPHAIIISNCQRCGLVFDRPWDNAAGVVSLRPVNAASRKHQHEFLLGAVLLRSLDPLGIALGLKPPIHGNHHSSRVNARAKTARRAAFETHPRSGSRVVFTIRKDRVPDRVCRPEGEMTFQFLRTGPPTRRRTRLSDRIEIDHRIRVINDSESPSRPTSGDMIVEQTPEQIGRGSTPLDESSVAGQVGKEVHVLIAVIDFFVSPLMV